MTYASKTTVSAEKSRFELETILRRYRADQFMYATTPETAMIQFRAFGRVIRFTLRLPQRSDKQFQRNGRGYLRSPAQKTIAIEQAERSLRRALLLCVRAKLESVESGIETFEQAFLAHVVLPDGKTANEWFTPQLQRAYELGVMPQAIALLPAREAVSDNTEN